MKAPVEKKWKDPVTAFVFAGYLVVLVTIYYLWKEQYLPELYIAGIAVLALVIIYLSLGFRLSISFGGFCMLVLGHHLLWELTTVPILLKVLGSVVTVLQLSTLGSTSEKPVTKDLGISDIN